MCFSDWGFAEDQPERWSIVWLIDIIINVLSWGWVLLAKLAWEFLTNKWVYGELLWLDALFWQYRNVVKNIANFCLWFYFVYIIFRWLIDQWKKSVVNIIKNKILWILLAWVWIQASWFFTSAMIDVSTITLVAAWSLPAQIIADNEKVHWSYKNSLAEYFDEWSQGVMYWKYIELFSTNSPSGKFIQTTEIPLQQPVSEEAFFDSLLPSSDSVSGPLYYMWFAILNANEINSIDSSSPGALEWSLLNLIIMWWTTIIYALEMFVLCVLALMRIIYLWMFIVLSPLAIFLWCLQMSKDDKVMKRSFVETLMKQINLQSFFMNIFKPTIIVLWLGIATIFASLMKWVLIENGNKPVDLWWLVITTAKMNTENGSEDKIYESTMDWGVLKFTIKYVWKSLLDFIMSIITVVLVYLIINFAVKMWEGKDFVSEKLKWVQKSVGWLVASLPVMPVTGYDEYWRKTTRYMSMGKVFWVNEDMKSDGSGWLLGAKIAQYQWWIDDEYQSQSKIISSWFQDNSNIIDFKTADQQEVIDAGETVPGWWLAILQAQLEKIRELSKRKPEDGWLKEGQWYWMTLNPDSNISFWRTQFEKWLTDVNRDLIAGENANVWKNMVYWWKNNENDRTLEKMFRRDSTGQYVRAYVKFFGLDSSITNWEQLKIADISEKKEEKKE